MRREAPGGPARRPPRRRASSTRWRRALAAMVEDQSDDIWGLVFLLLGALAALGIYAHVIGPAGRALRTGAADVFGLARYGLPACFAILGVYLLWRHERSAPGRVAVGLGIGHAGRVRDARSGPGEGHRPPARSRHGQGGRGRRRRRWACLCERAWPDGARAWSSGSCSSWRCLVITATPVRAVAQGGPGRVRGRATGPAAHLLSAAGGDGPAPPAPGLGHPPPQRQGARVAAAAASRRPAAPAPGVADGAPTGRRRRPSPRPVWAPVRSHLGVPRGRGPRFAAGVPGVAGAAAPPPGRRDMAGAGPRPGNCAAPASDAAPMAPGAPEAAAAPPSPVRRRPYRHRGRRRSVPVARAEQLAIDLGLPKPPKPAWRLPPVALLRRSRQTDVDRRQVEVLGQTLEGALAAHGVETRLVGATVGPSVTRYELELAPGVKVQKVTALQRDIAYAMAAADVADPAPIPGRSAIGVEVPNRQRQIVALGDILASPEAAGAPSTPWKSRPAATSPGGPCWSTWPRCPTS